MTITSPKNDKLKHIQRLSRRRIREREGLFVTEGEDLLAAARAAGEEPIDLLTAAGEALGGTEVEAALLDRFSSLGSGTRFFFSVPFGIVLMNNTTRQMSSTERRSPKFSIAVPGQPRRMR